MRDINNEIVVSPLNEARRYVNNAKNMLNNAHFNQELNQYEDRKYVRAAGHFLWNAILILLESLYHLKNNKHSRVDIDDYRKLLTKHDKKLLSLVNDAYEVMHLFMGYDGTLNKQVCAEGINLANEIIDRCERLLA